MADWTNLPNQAVGVGGLPSGTTVTALRDNPVAIAEGAAGAPRVQARGRAFEYLPQVTGTGTNINGWTGLDPLAVVSIFARGASSSGAFIQFRASNDGGSNYGSWINTLFPQSGLNDSGFVAIFLSAGLIRGNSNNAQYSSPLGVQNINALQVRGSASAISFYSAVGYALMRDEI